MPHIIEYSSGSEVIAVVDIGTNTLRLLIGCVRDGIIKRIESERAVTRLGEKLSQTGNLNRYNIEKSIKTLILFKAIYEKYRVKHIIAVGTSALRDAKNRDEFIQDVKKRVGIDISVISGEREAYLTLLGVRSVINLSQGRRSIIIDIGGGSTEIIFYHKEDSEFNKISIPVGAVKLLEQFIKNNTLTSSEISNINEYLRACFNPLVPLSLGHSSGQICSVIATGGTLTTLASINLNLPSYNGNKVHGHTLSYSEIVSIFDRLKSLSLIELYTIPGLEKERADIILPGTLILMSIMELLKVNELIVSDFGLMEGLLIETADELT